MAYFVHRSFSKSLKILYHVSLGVTILWIVNLNPLTRVS